MIAFLSSTAIVGLFVAIVMLGAGLLGERAARRENTRRQSAYREACALAARNRTRPPFPPNEVRWR